MAEGFIHWTQDLDWLGVRRVRISFKAVTSLPPPSPSPQVLQWGAADAELKSHLMRAQSLLVLHLKPGVGQYIAMHATLTARDFFLANFYPSGPVTWIFFFFQNLCRVFPVLSVANTSFCVGPQNNIGHPVGCTFSCWVLAEYKFAPKYELLFFWFCVPKLCIEFESLFERKKNCVKNY